MKIVHHDGSDYPLCDVCGVMYGVTVTFEKCGEVVTARCDRCERLINSGMIRPDRSDPDGTPRFRQWHFEWKPGRLVPRPRPS